MAAATVLPPLWVDCRHLNSVWPPRVARGVIDDVRLSTGTSAFPDAGRALATKAGIARLGALPGLICHLSM